MNQGRNVETEEEEEMVPQSEPEKQINQVKNDPQQQQVTQPLPAYQPRPEQHHISERAEGYRSSAIRESRIKDRQVSKTGASDSALKIKIELDLEVEVDLYARVKGDVTIGLM